MSVAFGSHWTWKATSTNKAETAAWWKANRKEYNRIYHSMVREIELQNAQLALETEQNVSIETEGKDKELNDNDITKNAL